MSAFIDALTALNEDREGSMAPGSQLARLSNASLTLNTPSLPDVGLDRRSQRLQDMKLRFMVSDALIKHYLQMLQLELDGIYAARVLVLGDRMIEGILVDIAAGVPKPKVALRIHTMRIALGMPVYEMGW